MEAHLCSPLHQRLVQRGGSFGRPAPGPLFLRVAEQVIEPVRFTAFRQGVLSESQKSLFTQVS